MYLSNPRLMLLSNPGSTPCQPRGPDIMAFDSGLETSLTARSPTPASSLEKNPRRRTSGRSTPVVQDRGPEHQKKPCLREALASLPTATQPNPDRLLALSELPPWRQAVADDAIATGYCGTTPGLARCVLGTARTLHNESVNIFSHLGGAVLFAALLASCVQPSSIPFVAGPFPSAAVPSLRTPRMSVTEPADYEHALVHAVYLLGVSACFACSALFHTLLCHSAAAVRLGLQLDLLGVVALMGAAAPPVVYHTFRERPDLKTVYWFATGLLSLLAAAMTLHPTFRRPRTKLLRVAVFGGLALSALVCVVHGIALHGVRGQDARFPLWSVGGTLTLDLLGATVYLLRFPERWWPGRFDLLGASHQVMHVAILGASLVWLAGMHVAGRRVDSSG